MKRPVVLTVALIMALLASACGTDATDNSTAASTAAPTSEAADEATITTYAEATTTTEGEDGGESESEVDGPIEPPALDPSAFGDSASVDNKYLPLTPGSQIVLEGYTIEEDEQIPHRIIFTVTGLTKEISGVTSVVVWIEDYEEDSLVEAEIAFFAQDKEGNVWNMGEYPEEYEDGEIVEIPSWIDGIEGAKAGIHMPANPQPNTPSYPQGWGPAVEWWDRARVFEVGSQTCVPVSCYDDVLIVDEFGLDELTAFQVKYYAPGIGNVQVGWKGDDPSGETLEMVAWNHLEGADLEVANQAALALEASGYENSDVYAQTEPMDPR